MTSRLIYCRGYTAANGTVSTETRSKSTGVHSCRLGVTDIPNADGRRRRLCAGYAADCI